MSEIVIGTRGSSLALWQANHVRDVLTDLHDGLSVRLEIIHTKGDKVLDTALHRMLDKGLFTKEIQNALLDGSVDLAVHSLKDLPTQPAPGLSVAAIPSREDPADALVGKDDGGLDAVPQGAEVLTGSLRRRAQLLHGRPDLTVSTVRGNVETRLRKLDESDARAIVLARAGLVRLGLGDRITARLDPAEFLPACGQGALAIETRADDADVRKLLGPLDDAEARAAVTAERAVLAALEGGCQVPVGAYAYVADGTLNLTGMVANLDGTRMLRAALTAPRADDEAAAALGLSVAEELRRHGCQDILDEVARHLQQEESESNS